MWYSGAVGDRRWVVSLGLFHIRPLVTTECVWEFVTNGVAQHRDD